MVPIPAEPAPATPQVRTAPTPASTTTPSHAAPEPPPQAAAQPALIDDQAKRLAEFFNGEVVQLDGPLSELQPELQIEAESDQAA